jgi:hypothetical protein
VRISSSSLRAVASDSGAGGGARGGGAGAGGSSGGGDRAEGTRSVRGAGESFCGVSVRCVQAFFHCFDFFVVERDRRGARVGGARRGRGRGSMTRGGEGS